MKARLMAGSVLATALLAVGCSSQTGDKARQAGEQAAEAAAAAGQVVQSAAGDAVRNVQRASQEAVGDVAQTAEVKAALIADARVDAAGIDVDTDEPTKTVRLSGHVPSAAQKLTAGQIAHEKAEGYEVRNELVVQP